MHKEATTVRPPLRWAGSKRQLLPVLGELWRPSDRRYIEAFAGSACLFFHISPSVAILNDSNEDLISAYRVLAERPKVLYRRLLALPVNSETYYRLRGSSPRSELQAAVRFFYLNRFCFNGIYRTNKNGAFNVPFGRKTGAFPSAEEWCDASAQLGRATLFSGDFEKVVLENVEPGDFVYLDPPYAVSNKRVFLQYSAREFGLADLERLRSVMAYIDAKGAVFVVSYAQSDETTMLSKGWFAMSRMAQRNVAGFSRHRRRAVEVIITNDPSRLRGRANLSEDGANNE